VFTGEHLPDFVFTGGHLLVDAVSTSADVITGAYLPENVIADDDTRR